MTHTKRMRGFSLLEVMVALIIIAIGMLGIAKMQGLALSSTTASRARALAAIEASSLAAAMQANRTYWASTAAPTAITITTAPGSPPTFTPTSTPAALATAISNAGGANLCGLGMYVSCICAATFSAPCTPGGVALAGADLYDFTQSLMTFLPTSTTSINCNPGDVPVDCTISITWTENAVALNSANAGAAVPVNFTLYVVP